MIYAKLNKKLKRERERERERERVRERERDRQTDRQTDRQRHTHTKNVITDPFSLPRVFVVVVVVENLSTVL